MFAHSWHKVWGCLLAAGWALGGLVCEGQFVDPGDRNLQVELAVEQALARPLSIDVRGLPLSEALREIGQSCGIKFLLDEKALQDAGIAVDTAVSASIRGLPGSTGLAVILRPLELTWLVRDGQPMITTVSQGEFELELRIYPVKDLVVGYDQQGAFADFDSLLELITGTVAPTTWAEVGGAASIKPYSNSLSIVITQTRGIHRQVDELLAGLRRARDIQGLNGFASSSSRSSLSVATPSTPTASMAPVSAGATPVSTRIPRASPTSRLVRVYD